MRAEVLECDEPVADGEPAGAVPRAQLGAHGDGGVHLGVSHGRGRGAPVNSSVV